MEIKKIRVVPFGLGKKLLELEDVTISTIEEHRMSSLDNEFWILDKHGNSVLYSFSDVRLQSITKDFITFVGYYTNDKFKIVKVVIFVWA